MNSLEKMLLELSVESVPRVSLGEVCKESTTRNRRGQLTEIRSVTNKSGLVITTDYFENSRTSADTSNYKVVEKGMFAYNPSRINVGSIAWNHEEHKIAVSPMYVVFEVDSQKVDSDYLMLFLDSLDGKQQILDKCEVGARFRLPFNSFSKISMPLPPLIVQRAISSILANFLQLEAELEAELEARKSQYEFYRNYLFSFRDAIVGVQWIPLGELVMNHDSRRKPVTRSARVQGDYPYYGANGVQDFVADFIFDGTFLLMGEDGSVINSDGTPVINWATGKIWVNNHAHVLTSAREDVDLRYLFHFLKSTNIREYVTGGSQLKINQGNMNRIPIGLPPLDEQIRIRTLLDLFEELTSNLNSGLPAEISARRQQYEYYRNKLLTFRALEVA